MATIMVIGAGLGGLSAAYELKAALGQAHSVILVSDKPSFDFTPSNPWVAVAWRKREQVSLPIAPQVTKKGIDLESSIENVRLTLRQDMTRF